MSQLGSLNPEQRKAVVTIRGPVLILAGAGTGKTRTITQRIAFMVREGIAPRNILGVTFTNKAAREMLERVTQLIPKRRAKAGEAPQRPTICTFHSLCSRILRRHIEKLDYKRNFVIYSGSDQLGVIKKLLSNLSLPKSSEGKVDPRGVQYWISRIKNAGFDTSQFPETPANGIAQHLMDRYQSALHACNAVDFDDLILLVLRLFKEHPEALETCRELYRYVMVDEYQDTNGAQFELVRFLTEEHRNLCVVGDDDQSIYGWRGAEASNILEFEKHFPEVAVIKLEQNYRSTNTILAAANAVIKNNARRRGKKLWSDQGDGVRIRLHSFEDDEAEANGIVEDIEFLRLSQKIPWADQAVLFRTNQQSRPFEIALRHAEVRYHLIGGQSFFDRREIRDFIAYAKTFVNPHDDVSLLRIANVPARGLSTRTMERLLALSHERECSVFSAMRHTDVQESFLARARDAIGKFVDLVEDSRLQIEESGDLKLSEWLTTFLSEIGYWDELRRTEKNVETAENRIRNLKDLIGEVDRFTGPSPAERLQAFLEDITLDAERESDKEGPGDAVTLITMHSCKGLEFPHVYVAGVEDGLLPHSRSKEEGTLDEERRLFYVAITRAQKSLSVSHCGSRRKFGQHIPCHPSRFLLELPADLVESADEAGNQQVTTDGGKSHFDALRSAIG